MIVPQITLPTLLAAASLEDFALHQAALEWSLSDPIIIQSAADIKSTVNWHERLKPFHHQVQNLVTFCRRLPVTLLTDDVGLGKTISAGLVLSELMVRNRISRVLVICPSILGPQWVEELDSKFGISAVFATGNELEKEIDGSADVVATTYQSATPRLQKIEPGKFDMLIIDEAHKLRNLYGVKKTPKMAIAIRKALDERLFKYVLLLTATPIQNRLWDIYSLVDCLSVAKGHSNPLGSVDQFRTRYIADRDARRLRPEQAEGFRAILRQYLVRTRRQDAHLAFPARQVKLHDVQPSIVDIKIQNLIAQHIDRMHPLVQVSVGVAMMSSPQALIAQLYNMGKRDPHWITVAEAAKVIIRDGLLPSKLTGLLQLIDVCRKERPSDWRLIVFTTRRETQNVICQKLDSLDVEFGRIQGGDTAHNTNTVKAFTASPPRINVIVSTDAGAEGINLQAGNVLVNYDLPWNPMVVEQRIGRIQRLGSKHGNVVIYNLAVVGSPEERIVARLMEKLQVIVETVGDIEAILEASYGDRDDSAATFENQIRELFIKSLKGQDIADALRKQIRSIERAKAEYEEHRGFMDSTLGQLDDLHHTGPPMPRLAETVPSMSVEAFVRSAFEADGFDLTERGENELVAEKSGRPAEHIIFDEQVWRSNAQAGSGVQRGWQLYKPGKPAFEKLVQRWAGRSAHYTRTFVDQTNLFADGIAARWLERLPGGVLESVHVLSAKERFQGQITLRLTANNAVDSYEKLIEIESLPNGHDRIPASAVGQGRLLYQELDVGRLDDGLVNEATLESASDGDISAFCDFYSSRLAEEVAKAGSDQARLKKVTDDFTPTVSAQAVAVTGDRYHECKISIGFSIEGHSGYHTEFEAIPLTGQILSERDAWLRCQQTNREVPSSCLDRCCLSQKVVLRHLLRVSDETGRKALEEYVQTCPVSGRKALQDEFLVSDVSGKRAVASAFSTSEMSRRRGLHEEVGSCEFTGAKVLVDELQRSEVSGKNFRADQSVASEVSAIRGHRSEFVICDYSKTLALPDECGMSDLSHCLVRLDRLETSTRPPHRRGTPDEMVVCQVTGQRLAQDETGVCKISNQRVDDQLLEPSEESGELGLKTQLVTCEVSGRRVLPSEAVRSGVSNRYVSKRLAVYSSISGTPLLTSEAVHCEFTRVTLAPGESIVSDLSGKAFRSDQAFESDLSGRRCHESEGATCAWSCCRLLADEAVRSDYSGRVMTAADVKASAISARRGHHSEFQICEFTGASVLPDEIVTSAVSERKFRRDEVFVSPTGRQGHRSEQARCDFSEQLLLADEVVLSAVSRRAVSIVFARRSEVSGHLAAPQELNTCEITGVHVLPTELVVSDFSGKRFRRDQQFRSTRSNRVGHTSECIECEYSGDLCVLDEVGTSDYSGKRISLVHLHESPVAGRRGSPSEFCQCAVSGQKLLLDELERSAVSGRRVDKRLLIPSNRSGKLALTNELVRCQASGVALLPEESGRCQASQLIVDLRLLVQSDFSAAVALREKMCVCSATGRIGIPQEFGTCELTGTLVARPMLERCSITRKFVRRDRLDQSVISGRWILADEGKRSFRDQSLMCPDEARLCNWNRGYLPKQDVRRCRWTGLTFARELIDEQGVFRELLNAWAGSHRNVFEPSQTELRQMQDLNPESLKGLGAARMIESPSGKVFAVFGELQNFWGFERGKVAFLMRKSTSGSKILGTIAFGSVDGNNWTT